MVLSTYRPLPTSRANSISLNLSPAIVLRCIYLSQSYKHLATASRDDSNTIFTSSVLPMIVIRVWDSYGGRKSEEQRVPPRAARNITHAIVVLLTRHLRRPVWRYLLSAARYSIILSTRDDKALSPFPRRVLDEPKSRENRSRSSNTTDHAMICSVTDVT